MSRCPREFKLDDDERSYPTFCLPEGEPVDAGGEGEEGWEEE